MNSEDAKSEKLGRLAFAYCKIATVSLLLGRFALPVAAGLSACFFIVAWFAGKKDTRCALRSPLLAAALWGVVFVLWLGFEFWPGLVPSWLEWVHR